MNIYDKNGEDNQGSGARLADGRAANRGGPGRVDQSSNENPDELTAVGLKPRSGPRYGRQSGSVAPGLSDLR